MAEINMAERIQSEHLAEKAMDDFKQVDGIGPAVEKRLHAAGILTYAQLARLKPEKLARLLDGMIGYSPKRIAEQAWTSQARKLAEQAPPGELHEPPNNSLHYASYTVELLLDRENQVRRTRLMHVQTRQETTWAGWDADRMGDFLVQSGTLNIGAIQARAVAQAEPAGLAAPSPQPEPLASRPASALRGVTRIAETRLLNQAGQPLGALIPGKTPFLIQLMLDLSQLDYPKNERLSYEATIYMKKMGKSGRELMGEKEGSLPAGKSAVIEISSQPLEEDDYSLEALVAVRPHSQPKYMKNQILALTESMLVHVY